MFILHVRIMNNYVCCVMSVPHGVTSDYYCDEHFNYLLNVTHKYKNKNSDQFISKYIVCYSLTITYKVKIMLILKCFQTQAVI